MVTLVNRAKMSITSTGTGTPITLGSAEDGYQSFADAGVSNGDLVRYVIEDGDNWEIGSGTYTASGTTLTRSVTESSNSDNRINLTADAIIFITAEADDIQQPPSEGAFADGDKTKLDGIETGADVTDTANVTAAGALMDSEVTNLAQVKAFDSSDYATAAQGTKADAALPKAGGTMTGALDLEGGSFSSGIDTNTNAALVVASGKQILGDDGNYLRNLVKWTSGNQIEVGQGSTALITGINLLAGSSGTVKANGQRVFAEDYHPNADKWTDARTITLGGDLSGNVSLDGSANVTLTATVSNDSHTHAFNNLTGKTSGTGDYATTGDLQSGKNSGGVALTINDGYGNANVTWNHKNGVPEQNGQSARIEVNTDSTSGEGTMSFEVSSAAVTSGTAVSLPVGMTLAHDFVQIPNKIQHDGDTDTYMQFHGADSWRVVTGGTERLEATNSGIRIDNAFTLPTTDGSANQVLTTDGSGNVSWTTQIDTNTNTNQLTTFVVQDGDSTNVTMGQGKYLKFAEGGAIDVNFTDTSTGSSGDPYDLTISHADTSSQGSVNNSNGTVIQDVTLDGYGHVTALGSVNLDGRYYTESEVNTFINRSYVSKHSASNLATGWYTIAQNTGDRAVARFALWDTNSSDHQSVIFYASHHYGTDASNTLTVLDNSYFSGNPFRYIRIKDAGTYDGAALQVYIDDATNSVNIAIVGDDVQSSGWDIVDFLADATAPSQVSNWANFGERSKIDLNQIAQGGLATTGPIYADGDTTQYRVFNDSYHPNADKWTTARTHTVTLTGAVTGSASQTVDGSGNKTWSIATTQASTNYNWILEDGDGTEVNITDGKEVKFVEGRGIDINWTDTSAGSDGDPYDLTFTGDSSKRGIARALGWIPAYGSATESNVVWDDAQEAVALHSSSDTSIGMAFKAVRVTQGQRLRFTVPIKSSAADSDGLYVRLYYYTGDLPDGKFAVSNSASHANVQEDTGGDTSWYENSSHTTSWRNFERSWTAPSTGYVSLVILNWSGFSGTVYAKQPDISLQDYDDLYVADQIIHTGDTDTYLQFHGDNLFRVVIAGAEVQEWGANYTLLSDNDTLRLGTGSDFRMWHDGTNTYFRNYNHSNGSIYFEGEDAEGTNHALLYMRNNVSSPYLQLFQNGGERLRTLSGGVGVTGLTVGDVDANPHNSGGLQVKPSGDEKIVLSGSSNPYIRWQEGTTDKAYIQWQTDGHLLFRNQENGNFVFRPSGTTSSVYLRFEASDGDVYGGVYANHSNEVGFLDDDSHWAYKITTDTNHEWRINNTAEMSLSASTLDMKGNTITEVEDIGLRDRIYHDGDTNCYIQFHATDQWRVVTGGTERLEVNNTNTTVANNLIVSGNLTVNGTAPAASAVNDIFWENGQNVSSNYTITNGKNAMSAGPITIDSGVTVTVGDGEAWTVV